MYFPRRGIVKRLIGKKIRWDMSPEMERESESKDGLDFGVEGDVGGGNSVDREFFAGGFRKLEEAADVIVFVVTGEEAFRFRLGQTEGGKGNRLSEFAGERTVQTDQFAQRHDGSAASGLSAHCGLLSRVYRQGLKVGKKLTQRIAGYGATGG